MTICRDLWSELLSDFSRENLYISAFAHVLVALQNDLEDLARDGLLASSVASLEQIGYRYNRSAEPGTKLVESAMLGYLNAPNPFTNDGWFNTGDKVEVDGDYFRILGRQSEIINVGGQKVYPAQVESVVQEMPEVAEVLVYGEKNAIMGQIVCAAVRLRETRDAQKFHSELRQFCRQRLQEFQIPVRVTLAENALYGERFKKNRGENAVA